jgi:protein-histidine pros-kinase
MPAAELMAVVRRAAEADTGLAVDVVTGLMVDFLREIADRSESEARLRRSEERFRRLLESAPDAVVIVNEEGEIVLVNDQTEMMFGYERRILLGKRVEFLLPERFHTEHTERRMEYRSAPRTRRMGTVPGLTGRRMDGREFPVDVSLSALETDEGTLVIGFVRDMSERERALTAAGLAGEARERIATAHAE